MSREKDIRHRKNIDMEKRIYKIRILCINVNRMRTKGNEKIYQLINFCKKNEVDIVQITKTNSKQITITESVIKAKFYRLGRELEIIFADSKAHYTTKSDWLQGGMLNLIRGKIPSLLKKEDIKKDDIGRWIVCLFINRKKKILIITIYRIPQGSD